MYKKKFTHVTYIALCNYFKTSKLYICLMSKMSILSLFGLIHYCEMSFTDTGMARLASRLSYSLHVLTYMYIYRV